MRVLFFLLGLLLILIFFHTRGVIVQDEGYILVSSLKFLHGQIPYKDFHFVYTPLSIFLTTLSFAIYPSLVSSRILLICISFLSSILLYKIIFLSTKNKLYSYLGVLLFIAWGPSHINFSWPINFVLITSLGTCYALLKFLETRFEKYLFFAGFLAFMVFLAKQNFGAAILLPIIFFFVIKNARRMQYMLAFAYGYSWGAILFGIYLLLTGSFAFFLSDIYTFTFQWIITNGSLNTPFIYIDTPIKTSLRTLLYLFPLFISIATFALLFIRRRFHLLFFPIYIIAFYTVGIRPTTDYIHLVPLLSLLGIPFALFLRYNISLTVRIATFLIIIFLIVLGFYTALFKGYYRWDSPLISHNNFYADPRGLVFVNDKILSDFSEIKNTVDKYTKSSDPIYVDSYTPMIYFIAKRDEANRDNFLSASFNGKTYYKNVQSTLIAKEVKLLFLNHGSLSEHPIKQYISSYYSFLKRIGDYDVYLRKK